jgi:phospholipid/cholesterol/gamma-HCH transport system permease protein
MTSRGELRVHRPESDRLEVSLSGSWRLGEALPSADDVRREIEGAQGIRSVDLDASRVGEWDTGLLTFLVGVERLCTGQKIHLEKRGIPRGAMQLLALAAAVPEKKDARKTARRPSFFVHVGNETADFVRSSGELLEFIGDAVVAVLNLLHGRARFRRADLGLLMASCGAEALPIVTLICFLVGLILAFIGAIQLALFGAQIYVADLVGIAMVRLMAAIMTGIVMAGRTGGAFAAQLGTMQVNQEIDALKTLGISPMEFLVLPRMLALGLMMPLLCLYANVMGILGGMVVGVGLLDIGLVQYYNETAKAVNLWNLGIGLFSGTVFGVIVALAGCMRGMQCGRSASAVGDAATSAVVTAIVGIIVSTALITVICNILGI